MKLKNEVIVQQDIKELTLCFFHTVNFHWYQDLLIVYYQLVSLNKTNVWKFLETKFERVLWLIELNTNFRFAITTWTNGSAWVCCSAQWVTRLLTKSAIMPRVLLKRVFQKITPSLKRTPDYSFARSPASPMFFTFQCDLHHRSEVNVV